jgi:hypothetical protein
MAIGIARNCAAEKLEFDSDIRLIGAHAGIQARQ